MSIRGIGSQGTSRREALRDVFGVNTTIERLAIHGRSQDLAILSSTGRASLRALPLLICVICKIAAFISVDVSLSITTALKSEAGSFTSRRGCPPESGGLCGRLDDGSHETILSVHSWNVHSCHEAECQKSYLCHTMNSDTQLLQFQPAM
jgi:hypothetical protein